MVLDIYNKVVEIIGELPPELTFVYGICTIIVFIMMIYCIILPYKLIFDFIDRW